MKILCDSGIVDGSKEGKLTHYKISDEGLKHPGIFFKSNLGALILTAKLQTYDGNYKKVYDKLLNFN